MNPLALSPNLYAKFHRLTTYTIFFLLLLWNVCVNQNQFIIGSINIIFNVSSVAIATPTIPEPAFKFYIVFTQNVVCNRVFIEFATNKNIRILLLKCSYMVILRWTQSIKAFLRLSFLLLLLLFASLAMSILIYLFSYYLFPACIDCGLCVDCWLKKSGCCAILSPYFNAYERTRDSCYFWWHWWCFWTTLNNE